MSLPGPSRTIIVEPVEEPATEREPEPVREPATAPAPQREPEPVPAEPEPEREPARTE